MLSSTDIRRKCLRKASRACTCPEETISKPPSFAHFMAFNKQQEKSNLAYWTRRLDGSAYPVWSTSNPIQPNRAYDVEDRLVMEGIIPMSVTYRTDGYTGATKVHAACCIVLSRFFQQARLILGRLMAGR